MAIYQDNRELIYRLKWLRGAFALLIVILLVKLWFLTVVQFEHMQAMANRNQIRQLPLVAPRGVLTDRNGVVLADSIPAFNLLLFLDEAEDLEATSRFLTRGLMIDAELLAERIAAGSRYAMFRPAVVQENLSLEDIAYVLAHQAEHPELKIFEQPRRRYPMGSLAAHVLGHVGEVSEAELQREAFEENRPGDIVGKMGLERKYNRELTGQDGYRRVLVNHVGKILEELEVVEPIHGGDLQLTLDADMQRVAEEAIGDSPGAAVALDPTTGEILVLASRPAFDPNLFATRISLKEWRELTENPDHPLQNRTIHNRFSPGSVFKIVVALAGLEKGLVSPSSAVYCNGAVELYGHRFRCWKQGGHGLVSLRTAIQQSCNVYFYLLGQKLGIENISHFSKQVGLGAPTGLDLLGEVSGLVPSEEWKRRTFGAPWHAGETISVAIGQGPIDVTPVQLARAIGVVSTGKNPKLHLVKGNGASELFPTLPFADENLQPVREAMWSVVNEWGTGRAAKVDGFKVCGKTGTVQMISNATRLRLSEAERERFEPNAWFVGFAPLDAPRLVVAVIVQRGGSGSGAAAPIAGAIFQSYYEKFVDPPKEIPGEFALKQMPEGVPR
jgi:penicillin-binding protein 2